MGSIYHVHRFNLRGELLLSPCVQWTGLLVIVLTWRLLISVLRMELTGLFKDPTTSVGMIGGFIGGAVDLTWSIKDSVQAG